MSERRKRKKRRFPSEEERKSASFDTKMALVGDFDGLLSGVTASGSSQARNSAVHGLKKTEKPRRRESSPVDRSTARAAVKRNHPRSARPFRVMAPLVHDFFRRRWFMIDVFDRAARATRDVKALSCCRAAPNNSYLCGGRLEPRRRRSLVRESRGAHPFSLRVHAAHGCCLRWCLRCLRGRDFEKENERKRR